MVSPILKWAGGKRWLVAAGALPIPTRMERFVEPFLGGGSVFFHLEPKKALLSDANKDLIELYSVIRRSPTELHRLMFEHQDKHSTQHYYTVRNNRPTNKLARAARFLYLNRTCWNGLYRVNLAGDFNVPIGTKDTVLLDTDDFVATSNLLKFAKLKSGDFELVVDECNKGDFLFVDPPYTVRHNYNGFLKYNERIFNWADQIKLRDALLRARSRGVSIVVTNADHESIHDIYDGLGDYIQLTRKSVLAGDSHRRGSTTEAMYLVNVG